MIINTDELNHMSRFDRVNFTHSLTGFKSPIMIGTKGRTENIGLFSSIFHLGSNPPLLGIKFRPVTDDKHTYKNIRKSGILSLNLVDLDTYKQAHQTSARLDENVSEFDFTGLSTQFHKNYNVPLVKEAKIKAIASYVEEYRIKANDTIVMVVKIEQVEVLDGLIMQDGCIDLTESKIVALNGLYNYAKTQKIDTLGYVQKPE